ncbi:hypothetical protein QN277_014692 [Acacia crassicarpa]|uniref:Uncharacterized protein n=1 Tax=Acacia crassicarpa TaxID=499986 RepID=A0AAE1KJ67_9FABA|nr:hypothetical protein QN277_014692 [Acacia crassicarpa]
MKNLGKRSIGQHTHSIQERSSHEKSRQEINWPTHTHTAFRRDHPMKNLGKRSIGQHVRKGSKLGITNLHART